MKVRMIKKVWLAALVCLLIGLQSMGMVQAAVNYEACPFCGTRVNNKTETREIRRSRLMDCKTHNNCTIYMVTYDYFDVTSCETPGCAFNRTSQRNSQWDSLEHSPN